MESKTCCFSICQKAYCYGYTDFTFMTFNRLQWRDIHLMFEIPTACLDSSSVLWLVQAGQPSAVAVSAQLILSLLLPQPEPLSSVRRVQLTVLFRNVRRKDDSTPFSVGSKAHRTLYLPTVSHRLVVCRWRKNKVCYMIEWKWIWWSGVEDVLMTLQGSSFLSVPAPLSIPAWCMSASSKHLSLAKFST